MRVRVFCIKANGQAFGEILDATIEGIPVSGENVEVTQMFIHLEIVNHTFMSCEPEVNS